MKRPLSKICMTAAALLSAYPISCTARADDPCVITYQNPNSGSGVVADPTIAGCWQSRDVPNEILAINGRDATFRMHVKDGDYQGTWYLGGNELVLNDPDKNQQFKFEVLNYRRTGKRLDILRLGYMKADATVDTIIFVRRK